MLQISGTYRVQSIYKAEKVAYLTLKDKSDGSIIKVSHSLPLPAPVVDDGLVKLDGKVSSRLYGNNVTLTYEGVAVGVKES